MLIVEDDPAARELAVTLFEDGKVAVAAAVRWGNLLPNHTAVSAV
jgi:CheY-like chemotaxis protein